MTNRTINCLKDESQERKQTEQKQYTARNQYSKIIEGLLATGGCIPGMKRKSLVTERSISQQPSFH